MFSRLACTRVARVHRRTEGGPAGGRSWGDSTSSTRTGDGKNCIVSGELRQSHCTLRIHCHYHHHYPCSPPPHCTAETPQLREGGLEWDLTVEWATATTTGPGPHGPGTTRPGLWTPTLRHTQKEASQPGTGAKGRAEVQEALASHTFTFTFICMYLKVHLHPWVWVLDICKARYIPCVPKQ